MATSYPPTPPLSQIVRQAEASLVCITTPHSTGSGFVADTDGHVITNAHVVDHHAEVLLEFVDGGTYTGAVVGVHPRLDLACVRLPDGLEPPPLELGDSASAQVGEDVVAMGYPLSEILKGSPTVTRGIVSAKRLNDLQTDAAINPGNSGGPLLDSYGRVIGVNTSILAPADGRVVGGIGFAIPINDVKDNLGLLTSGDHAATTPVSAPKANNQGASTVHHFGDGGFSVDLPLSWALYQSDQRSPFFVSEDSSLSLSVFRVDVNYSLRKHADDMYKWQREEVRLWPEGSVAWHGKASTSDSAPYSVSWQGDRGDGRGPRYGLFEWLLLRSATGSVHLVFVALEVPRNPGRQTAKRVRRSELSETVASVVKTITIWDTYWSDLYYWSIAAAPGWNSTQHSDAGLVLNPGDDGTYVTVDIVDVDDYVSTEELCKDAVADQLTTEDAWEGWDILSSHEDDYEGHNWYRINFRYQPQGYQPAAICIIQVGRSGSLEYIVTARTDEYRISEHASAIDHMLESFRLGLISNFSQG